MGTYDCEKYIFIVLNTAAHLLILLQDLAKLNSGDSMTKHMKKDGTGETTSIICTKCYILSFLPGFTFG